ncbi:MAG: GNAT family N-acetyltransferase [Fuerstiella sp.]
MVQYRTFLNSDPPGILKLWHASQLGPGAAEGFPCGVFDMLVFSQPYFDSAGFFLAIVDEQVVGFCHAGFAANEERTQIDKNWGTIAAIVVHPEFRRQGIGSHLLQLAEQYLTDAGTKQIIAGAGLGNNGFYNGIYGGLTASGFVADSFEWNDFWNPKGYSAHQTTQVLHRDLNKGRDPISARLLRHRRSMNLAVTDRIKNMSWWWHTRFCYMDTIRFELQQRTDESVAASAHITGLDIYIPKWGIRSVGLHNVLVAESDRRQGYGLSLVIEICKRLREQSISVIEVQVDENDEDALKLFGAAKFEEVQRLICFRKELP